MRIFDSRSFLRRTALAVACGFTAPVNRAPTVVVFGAGHAYWLRHFVEQTPGYRLVEPNLYLSAAE